MKNSKYQAIREEIALRAEANKILRMLRKTVHCPFTPEQREAKSQRLQEIKDKLDNNYWSFWYFNTIELRHLYIAYRIIKGKEPVYPTKKEYSEKKIQDLVEKFKPKQEEAA